MSVSRVVCLVATVLQAFAAEPARVGILLTVPPSTPEAVVEALRAETEESLRMTGIHIEWRPGHGQAANETFDRVVSLVLTGPCRPTRSDRNRTSHTLGITHISDGLVLPFVEIDCGTVLRVMESGNAHISLFTPPNVFGRALGRVAVHEIHHVLTASSIHDNDGLTKATFTRTDLTLGGLHLTDAAVQRLRHCLGQTDLETQNRGQQRAHSEE
ncbi:hypothetical protein [uncultured Paludibaculum sp.]|uniref:hypothetical protein n=1 Tax=uncultured Paludibaculum sp. TaxID=1765020 RepID=UPI002AAB4117|nr:hypothetical protein [uncultured Paludibaculum sp.]